MRNILILLSLFLSSVLFPGAAVAYDSDKYVALCYHDVLDNPYDAPDRHTVSTAVLVQQFSWMKANGYNVISIEDITQAHLGKKKLPPNAVLLTFDDGYKSFYTTVYPLLKQFHYPAVFALEGTWLEMQPGETMQYNEALTFNRSNFVTQEQILEMMDSGLVEVASHSYDLHRSIVSNPQGSLTPDAVTKLYNEKTRSYETDEQYEKRIGLDLLNNSLLLQKLTGKTPRVMVWPFGRYNAKTIQLAKTMGMPINLTLDEGLNSVADPLDQIHRYLMTFQDDLAGLKQMLAHPEEKSRTQRVMHVDLDYIYDSNPAQQEANLGKLLDRVKKMQINTVYLQAYADPDGNGAANSVYFPNRHLPMRADLFNRVAWQLFSRAGVKVYAWMPLLAFELPNTHPLFKHRVLMDAPSKLANSVYPRLSPFDPEVRQLIREVYEDLGKSAIFEGILFHDDATLNDYEDGSQWALSYYQKEWNLPASVTKIRKNRELFSAWSIKKTEFITQFSLELADILRNYQPRIKTARNMYAEVVLNPPSMVWFGQSLPNFLASYDYTAIMAMPYMENAQEPNEWLTNLVQQVALQPNGLLKSVFELQAVDWRNETPVNSKVLAGQMKLLQTNHALNFGYYPDNFLTDSPQLEVIYPYFTLGDFPYSK